jgi:hypothetical protein
LNKIEFEGIEDIMFYRVLFKPKAGTHEHPQFTLKPVSNMEEDVFEGNSKKVAKKSVLYLKAISSPSLSESKNLFTKVPASKLEQYLKETAELEAISANITSEPLNFEVQTYSVSPDCPLVDRLIFPEVEQSEESKEITKK